MPIGRSGTACRAPTVILSLGLAASVAFLPEGPHDLILQGFFEVGVFQKLFDLGAGLAGAYAFFAVG
jgi:hypothetical protein